MWARQQQPFSELPLLGQLYMLEKHRVHQMAYYMVISGSNKWGGGAIISFYDALQKGLTTVHCGLLRAAERWFSGK